METRGQLRSITLDYATKNAVISLEVAAAPEDVERYMGKELKVGISQYRQRRGLTQNAYYWKLATEVAEKLRISTTCLHNMLLREHPRPFVIGDKVAHVPIPDTDKAWNEALESESFHVKPSSQVILGTDGIMYRTYTILRGSSDYDTKEMSVLIDDLIEKAKEIGVETATPDELARMRAYEEERER